MGRESPIPVPTCCCADVDAESSWHVLLLEDLEWLSGASGAPDDQELARLHERWWAAFIREVGKPLPDEVMEIGELLGKHRGRIARYLFTNEPRTLLHGDYGVGNLMFGPTAEDSFSIVDWQFIGRGRGIWDVAYVLLSQSPVRADRQAIEMDLLPEYLGILQDHGVRSYSFDDAVCDYRISLLRRFGSIISTIAAIPITSNSIRTHVEVLLPRLIAALLDHDCGSLFSSGPPLPP